MLRNLSLFLLGFFLLIGCRSSHQDISIPPKGYSSNTTLKIAYISGALKLIDKDFPLPPDIKEYKDVVYKTVDSLDMKLDIYHSKKLDKNAPLIIFVHGGAWKKGDKHDYWTYLISYAKKGYVTATVQYRFANVAKFPAQLEDVEAAVRWLKTNAAEYHINPAKLALVGGSAGGQLVLMDAYTNSGKDLVGNQVSAKVQAVVNFYGPSDLTVSTARDNKDVQNFIGKSYEEAPDLYKNASPIFFVSKNVPPTLTFHGTLDELVPYVQSDRLHDSLQKAGAVSYYHKLEGWPHTMDLASKVNAFAQFYMDIFFKKYLAEE